MCGWERSRRCGEIDDDVYHTTSRCSPACTAAPPGSPPGGRVLARCPGCGFCCRCGISCPPEHPAGDPRHVVCGGGIRWWRPRPPGRPGEPVAGTHGPCPWRAGAGLRTVGASLPGSRGLPRPRRPDPTSTVGGAGGRRNPLRTPGSPTNPRRGGVGPHQSAREGGRPLLPGALGERSCPGDLSVVAASLARTS